jgi:hypothetical protein
MMITLQPEGIEKGGTRGRLGDLSAGDEHFESLGGWISATFIITFASSE